jgi:hypothetical protein
VQFAVEFTDGRSVHQLAEDPQCAAQPPDGDPGVVERSLAATQGQIARDNGIDLCAQIAHQGACRRRRQLGDPNRWQHQGEFGGEPRRSRPGGSEPTGQLPPYLAPAGFDVDLAPCHAGRTPAEWPRRKTRDFPDAVG